MIRTTLTIDNRIDEAIDYFQDTLNAESVDVATRLAPIYLTRIKEELRQQIPPPRTKNSPKIVWTSDKQRRAFFASNGFGKGIPTRRSFSLIAGWQYEIKQTGAGVEVVYSNDVPYARYVVGTLAQNPTARNRFIQIQHKIQGWRPAAPTVYKWLGLFREDFIAQLQDRFGALAEQRSKQRAFTSRGR